MRFVLAEGQNKPAFLVFLVQNDSSHDFFARSPSIYTILPPRVVVKLCKLRENVQKSHVTSHFVLEKPAPAGEIRPEGPAI